MTALDEFGESAAVMTVSGRVAADRLGNEAIARMGVTSQARPVTTLSALAFRIITAVRSKQGLTCPKLLNGAEQDSLLREVLADHIGHVRAGDPCDTCRLLAAYFAASNWTGLVSGGEGESTTGNGAAANDDAAAATSDALLTRGISDAFINQLRDIIARMNELGATPDREDAIIGTLADADGVAGARAERLAAQWRLAFALRGEYEDAIRGAYPGEYRLDASRLLVAGTAAVRDADGRDIPRAVVVDDAQDMTLAGMAFLQELGRRGCALVLVGNPDEAVQGFRGSYPEMLFQRVTQSPSVENPLDGENPVSDAGATATVNDLALGRLGALAITLRPYTPNDTADDTPGDEPDTKATYRDIVTARVSLGILSVEPNPLPVQQRPGKMPRLAGSLPIARTPETETAAADGSVACALYRSAGEELDDVVWHIMHAHMAESRSWNDMAVIAHDNATVRVYGERLRREGVPVRYSTVTRPLKEEPFVQGLFAMVELAELRLRGLASQPMGERALAGMVRSRLRTLLSGPLVTVRRGPDAAERPVRVGALTAALRALESLARVTAVNVRDEEALTDGAVPQDGDDAALRTMMRRWDELSATLETRRHGHDDGVTVDDSLFGNAPSDADPAAADDPSEPMAFNADAMLLLLAQGGDGAERVIRSVHAVLGTRGSFVSPEAEAFERVWAMVGELAESMRTLPRQEARYVLWQAWQTAGVAERWQRAALENTERGRAANDRLDAAMRLFQFSESGGARRDVDSFIDQVRDLEIEADSLAQVKPVEQAVTLTTPAGSVGRSWPLVWLPALQQGVWPNLAARNTMFGTEDLADVMLHGRIGATDHADLAPGRSERMAAVLYGEKKSLLVALTRATVRVQVSAVLDDDHMPSDFLYGFMPERFSRLDEPEYTDVGRDGDHAGLEYNVRGIVAAARGILARRYRDDDVMDGDAVVDGTVDNDIVDAAAADDAARTLAYLAGHGVDEADPAHWPFLHDVPGTVDDDVVDNDDVDNDDVDDDIDDDADDGDDKAAVFSIDAIPTGVPSKERAAADGADGDTVVTLSPSAVDGIWNCPVCWLMDNRFAGPRSSGVASGFGTVIHAVAERASAERLDLPGTWEHLMRDDAVRMIHERMMELYRELRIDPDDAVTVADRYAALRKDRSAPGLLRHIAEYFVDSNDVAYASSRKATVEVGTLVGAECEKPFVARFSLDDIVAAYNAVPDAEPVGRGDLYAMIGTLVGGWPEGMSPDLTVRISGRMDREEIRELPDGTRHIRLIDYKTGRGRTAKQSFSDLQLVCYQLGLVFDETKERRMAADLPDIAQSGLFFVAEHACPSHRSGPEGCHQPALFHDGHLNAEPFLARNGVPALSRLFDDPELPAARPAGIGETAWRRLLGERGTQTMWALTMVARVFYAAGAVESRRLVAHPDPAHVGGCWHKDSCPACADDITSVLEVRS
nr:PD-(D/E)XK nuclease family protein [Bifidobacterium pluvialisilvae]